MVQIKRINSSNLAFTELIVQLDNELFNKYSTLQTFYDQFNKTEHIDTVIIALDGELPVGCGCFKIYDKDCVEIKRMFVRPDYRGKGIAKLILADLEKWAKELGFFKAILETGIKQTEAIGLYDKAGYKKIKNYGQYRNIATSVCFQKNF